MSSPATHARQTPSDAFSALLRRPGYPAFVLTVSLSRIVSAMFATAGVLLVLQRTHSAALAGLVTAAAILPAALVGPAASAWLDVVRRRRVLIVADQASSFLTLFALALLAGRVPDAPLIALAVAYGITRPFSIAGFQSPLAVLAGSELLDRASAIEATSMNLALVVGPAIAAVLAGVVGPARVVELQAVLSLLVAALIAVNPDFEARGAQETPRRILAVVREGTRGLLGQPLLRDATAASLIASFGWGVMIVTFPLWAAQALHAGRNAGGYLFAALAVGSIAGTFALPGPPTRRRVSRSCAAVGLSGLLWLLAGSVPVAIGLVWLTGFVEGPFYSGGYALRQRLAPPRARGQVLGTIASLSMVALSAGSILGGALGDPATTFWLFAALNLVAAAIVGRTALVRRRPPVQDAG